LRWFDGEGNWLLTPAEQQKQRADRLAQKLQELGIDPNSI